MPYWIYCCFCARHFNLVDLGCPCERSISPDISTAVLYAVRNRVVVAGTGPSARYAHTLALVANRFLVAMGGNDGKATLSDAWALDTSEKPYQWKKISDTGAGDMPSARMYATAAARSDGLLLLCGGRDESGVPLGDAYGLARHRDGRWEWATAPGECPPTSLVFAADLDAVYLAAAWQPTLA